MSKTERLPRRRISMYTCPRETPLLPHIVFPVLSTLSFSDIIVICTTRREDPLPRALCIGMIAKWPDAIETFQPAVCSRLEKSVRRWAARITDATRGSDAQRCRRNRLCVELARRSRSGRSAAGHAIYKLSVSTRAARVIHRDDDDLRNGNETRPLRACESRGAHRMHARMYARMHARRADARRYVWLMIIANARFNFTDIQARNDFVSYSRRMDKGGGAQFLDRRYRSSFVR